MPTYIYFDKETDFEKEVFHSMSELDNPSEKTLEKITYEGRVMSRRITAPNFLSFNSKSPQEKKEILQKRAKSQVFQANRENREKKDYIDGKDLPKKKPKGKNYAASQPSKGKSK